MMLMYIHKVNVSVNFYRALYSPAFSRHFSTQPTEEHPNSIWRQQTVQKATERKQSSVPLRRESKRTHLSMTWHSKDYAIQPLWRNEISSKDAEHVERTGDVQNYLHVPCFGSW